MSDISFPLRVTEIERLIPHRYPFLLIDVVTKFEHLVTIEGIKNVTINEPFFAGHFPGLPIMPGVLMLEALAQLGAVFAKLCRGDEMAGKIIVFAGAENVRFRKQVLPGDSINLRMDLVKSRSGLWKMQGTATVINGEVAVEGLLIAAEVDKA